jgi:hypothetical protein
MIRDEERDWLTAFADRIVIAPAAEFRVRQHRGRIDALRENPL